MNDDRDTIEVDDLDPAFDIVETLPAFDDAEALTDDVEDVAYEFDVADVGASVMCGRCGAVTRAGYHDCRRFLDYRGRKHRSAVTGSKDENDPNVEVAARVAFGFTWSDAMPR